MKKNIFNKIPIIDAVVGGIVLIIISLFILNTSINFNIIFFNILLILGLVFVVSTATTLLLLLNRGI